MSTDGSEGAGGSASLWRVPEGFTQVTTMLSILGAVVTGTYTLASEYFQARRDEHHRDREIVGQTAQFDRELERDYFIRAVDPEATPEGRARVLRYLVASSNVGPEMHEWAVQELQKVKVQAEAQQGVLEEAAQAATARAQEADEEIGRLEADVSQLERDRLEKRRTQQRSAAARLTARATEIKQVAKGVPEPTGLRCQEGTARATDLRPGSPSHEIADGYCQGSAALKHFDPGDMRPTWRTRRGGRNYTCTCDLTAP